MKRLHLISLIQPGTSLPVRRPPPLHIWKNFEEAPSHISYTTRYVSPTQRIPSRHRSIRRGYQVERDGDAVGHASRYRLAAARSGEDTRWNATATLLVMPGDTVSPPLDQARIPGGTRRRRCCSCRYILSRRRSVRQATCTLDPSQRPRHSGNPAQSTPVRNPAHARQANTPGVQCAGCRTRGTPSTSTQALETSGNQSVPPPPWFPPLDTPLRGAPPQVDLAKGGNPSGWGTDGCIPVKSVAAQRVDSRTFSRLRNYTHPNARIPRCLA